MQKMNQEHEPSEDLKAFFVKVTNDLILQNRLYVTNEISDVAVIANELGFKVTAAEILKAQAGRVLAILHGGERSDLEELLAGRRAKTGAQWGRAGKGYLERAGFWLLELEGTDVISPIEKEVTSFLLKMKEHKESKEKLLAAKSFNDIASVANEHGYNFSSVSLLQYQANKILALSDQEAQRVACGAGSQVS